jgi:hypothetical protein
MPKTARAHYTMPGDPTYILSGHPSSDEYGLSDVQFLDYLEVVSHTRARIVFGLLQEVINLGSLIYHIWCACRTYNALIATKVKTIGMLRKVERGVVDELIYEGLCEGLDGLYEGLKGSKDGLEGLLGEAGLQSLQGALEEELQWPSNEGTSKPNERPFGHNEAPHGPNEAPFGLNKGPLEEVFAMLEVMQADGIDPDRVTFNTLLAACSGYGITRHPQPICRARLEYFPVLTQSDSFVWNIPLSSANLTASFGIFPCPQPI